MPTHEEAPKFWRDWDGLSRDQQQRFLDATKTFIDGLRKHPPEFDPNLRVKRVKSWPDAWEMTWASNGRAVFKYGQERQPGEPHVIWLRIGTHDIFREP